ncbi:MAG: translocation/assembly module TamB domain-containing protein, partial [Muribaculaceae bacterium]
VMYVDLNSIRLISIFETLGIDNALISGTATGTFQARSLLSSIPVLTTDNLHVDQIGYNYCTIGDADIRANWDNDRQSFHLDADIVNPEQQHSRIYGDIFAAQGALDLTFDVNHARVGFMRPFMAAFTSAIDGYVSGHARLFGTFKDIDMEGDIFAEDLRLKIDFTNTWYSATDSIHVRPGRIDLDNITIRDVDGHTARLNGYLLHDYFHRPVFDFQITDAHDFLCYNVSAKQNDLWYGTIYGNGSASVKGRPGLVEIGANMTTAPHSTFTFVLSDQLEAQEYSFISFRDVTPVDTTSSVLNVDNTPQAVKDYLQRISQHNVDKPSDYVMDITVDVTPDAEMIVVMDPIGGDRIRAFGRGNIRMAYNSADNDIYLWGLYTLDHGKYNFTLQDIIIKEFTINRGSSIEFKGDPYSAILDIEAIYQLNANLSDLDESFTQDKDLNRTNVPVQAVMIVTDDMRQPDIRFDLNFPTLNADVYRKVRSIVSTDDMMNRQIIYLLALNRFYTPDYMASTTRSNELFSVASSTISSQLSSMLGKLSDNWSIAPNLRSDQGDFSDLEVDLALSSRLLNNRLLFNGNFGYRDKSLNSNQFVGDFDIEYLLTPSGNWRLKAYNRYNDQNYYLRTATTTQGVGIMFRHDFDYLFRGRSNKSEPSDSIPASDSIQPLNIPDSQ